MTAADVAERLRGGAWFRRIEPAFRDDLLARGRVRTVPSGSTLFARGDPSTGLYAVLEGAIEIAGVDADGQRAILALLEAPMWFGEVAVLDGLPRTHDARAVRETRLFHVAERDLAALFAARPALWRELAWLTTGKLRLSFRMTEISALSGAERRLASHLLMIVQGYDEADAARSAVRISQEQLAAMLSMSRQTVNRILKRLEAAGHVRLGHGRIALPDVDRFRTLAMAGG